MGAQLDDRPGQGDARVIDGETPGRATAQPTVALPRSMSNLLPSTGFLRAYVEDAYALSKASAVRLSEGVIEFVLTPFRSSIFFRHI